MVRSEADWKQQPWYAPNLVMIGLATALLLAFTGLWWFGDGNISLGPAVVFAAWLGLFLSSYWQPVLYLLFGVVLVVAGVFLGFNGFLGSVPESAVLVGTVVFTGLSFALFVFEELVGKEAERKD
jgi:hypothetical protein